MGGAFSHPCSLLCQTNRYATTTPNMRFSLALRAESYFLSHDIRTLPFPSCAFSSSALPSRAPFRCSSSGPPIIPRCIFTACYTRLLSARRILPRMPIIFKCNCENSRCTFTYYASFVPALQHRENFDICEN